MSDAPRSILRQRALVPFVLLIVTTTLAGALTYQRRNVPLGARVIQPGWSIAFRLPAGWERVRPRRFGLEDVVVTRGPTADVFADRMDNVDRHSAADILDSRLTMWATTYQGLGRLRRRPEPVPLRLGDRFDGAYLLDPQARMILATALVGDEAYTIAMVAEGELTGRDVSVFDRILSSIVLVDGG